MKTVIMSCLKCYKQFVTDFDEWIQHQQVKMVALRLAAPFAVVLVCALLIRTDLVQTYTLKGSTGSDQKYGINKINEQDINESIAFANQLLNNMERLETNLGWADIRVKSGTPSRGMFIAYGPEKEALKMAKEALVANKATAQLMNSFCMRHNMHKQECVRLLSNLNFSNNTLLKSSCNLMSRRCTQEEKLSSYRSLDGSCNNIKGSSKGESFTVYKRIMAPDYLDGIHEFRRAANKRRLPSPRTVSVSLDEEQVEANGRFTMAVAQWGHFLENDISRPATAVMIHTGEKIECCGSEGQNLSPRYLHPFCSPIQVSYHDKHYSKKGINCMSYVRSLPALRSDCSFGPSDQVNQETHYIDASHIYGSVDRKNAILRSYVGGRLDASVVEGREYLPLSKTPEVDCYPTWNNTCFKSGDARVNVLPHLIAMHTLWLREHNRVARELAKINKDWSDEDIFQEARKIVIAEIQHITYNEWVGKLIDKKNLAKMHKFEEYDSNVDASVSNTFATAVIRAVFSLLNNNLELYDSIRSVKNTITLKDAFSNPSVFRTPEVLDGLIRGLATQTCQKVDMNYNTDLTNNLFTNGIFGFDILSMDIQRGRDHGLPGYTKFRPRLDLPEAERFEDFKDLISAKNIKALSNVYSDPKDVDLIVGGLLEEPVGDSLFGPTFSYIMLDQMIRSRSGDRYFYTNKNQPRPFTKSQLDEIKKVTLASVFCANADDVKFMQRDVFERISQDNNLVSCESIPRMNLDLWDIERERYFTFYK